MNQILLNKTANNSTTVRFHQNITYISYRALERIPWIRHGFSTRIGGVSNGHFSSMNLGLGRDDFKENVIRNHEIIAAAVGFCPENIVTGKQTHTTNIRVVTRKDVGKGLYRDRDYDNIDGLITNEREVVLTTYFADCVPLYIVDTKNKAIGLSHSGWRGTVGKMGKVTIEKMMEEYGTNPADVIACIGPSICKNCYEISEDVAVAFMKEFQGREDEILVNKGNGKYLLDLWECNAIIFRECGVSEENIHLPDICTCCNPDILFSHRASHGKRGNLAAFLEIK